MSGLHDFSADTLGGKPLKLSRFKGRVAPVVNTASQCGLTPQYRGLEDLHQRFQPRGLAVIRRYAPQTEPKELVADIETALAA